MASPDDPVSRARASQPAPSAHRGFRPRSISDLQEALEALRESERRHQLVIDNVKDVVFQTDAAGAWLSLNPAWTEITGFGVSESLGKVFLDFVHPDDRDLSLRLFQPLIERRKDYCFHEIRYLTKDGGFRWIEVHARLTLDDEGGIVGTSGVLRDVTRRKEAEEALQHAHDDLERRVAERTAELSVANERLRAEARERAQAEEALGFVMAHARCLLWYADVSAAPGGYRWRIHVVDEEAAQRFLPLEVQPDESYTNAWHRSKLPEDRRRMGTMQAATFDSGSTGYRQEFRCRDKHGEIRWLHEEASVEPTGRGAWRLAGVCTDVTEHKRMQQQLLQSQKMEVVGQMAGGIAHDFNNLLVPIITYSDLLLTRFEADDPLRRYAEQISKTAERAASLPRQLLAFSRKQVLQPKVISLNALIGDMGKMLQRLIGEDVALTVVPGDALGQVRADPGQIEQVITNLAVNARDAMPEGGGLALETANVDLEAANPRLREGIPPGRYVLLSISDTGCGMDPETQARIFEPFFTTKEVGKGTGLGLSTVHGIVAQSGGHIRVESEVGRGTTFRIYLPWLDGAEDVAAEPGEETAAGGAEVILLAEDDAAVREGVQECLNRAGYTVLTAPDGGQAITLSQEHPGPIHLLLTDVVMPGMSGRQLAERLSVRRPETKVLYMSGYTDDAVVRHGVMHEQVAFLQKPFTPQTLLRRLRQVLDGSGAG